MTKSLHTQLGLIDARTVAGFVVDRDKPERKYVVEILADGVPIAVARADRFSPALKIENSDADAQYGFVFALPERLAATTHVIAARLANLRTAVGKPINLDLQPKFDPALAAAGAVESITGLVIAGWVRAAPGSAMLMRARTAGEEVAATIARAWTSRTLGGEERPVLGFQLHLPPVLADGRLHLIEISTANGVVIAGSPVKFIAKAVPKR